MIPEYLLIENFMGHKKTEIDCSVFDSVLIVGQNKNNPLESNGTGKTTIFYAIDYALFGIIPSDTIDEIVRDGCDECNVVFDFSNSLGTYRIMRTRRRKSKKSYIKLYQKNDDKWYNISQKTATSTSNEIAKIINISYSAFKNSVLFSQFDLNGLVSDNPNERKNTLKEALGLSVYRKFEDLAKKDIKIIRADISSKNDIIKTFGNPDEDILDLKRNIKEIENNINQNKKLRDSLDDNISKNTSKFIKLEYELNINNISIRDRLDLLRYDILSVTNEIVKHEAGIDGRNKNIELINNNVLYTTNQLEECNNLLSQLIKNDFRDSNIIEKEFKLLTDEEIDIKGQIKSLKIKRSDLSKPLPSGIECSECFQPLTDEHRQKHTEKINVEIAEVDGKIKSCNLQLENCLKNKKLLQDELAKSKANIKNINDINMKIDLLKDKINNYEKTLTELQDTNTLFISSLNSKKKQLDEMRSEEESLLLSYNKDIHETKQKEVNNLKFIIKDLKTSYQEILEKISSDNTMLGVYGERLFSRENDKEKLDSYKIEIEELKKKLKIAKIVTKGFSPKGIPTMVIYTILNDLQTEVNNKLLSFKPGLELQFVISKERSDGESEDTLDIKFFVHGKERSYKLLSGGQKFLFAVSLKLGLSLVIQKKLGVDIKFIELDEVDQSLDKAAVDTYFNVIKTLQKDFKVFVITHNDTLKYKFSHAILVEGDERNGATSRIVTSWN